MGKSILESLLKRNTNTDFSVDRKQYPIYIREILAFLPADLHSFYPVKHPAAHANSTWIFYCCISKCADTVVWSLVWSVQRLTQALAILLSLSHAILSTVHGARAMRCGGGDKDKSWLPSLVSLWIQQKKPSVAITVDLALGTASDCGVITRVHCHCGVVVLLGLRWGEGGSRWCYWNKEKMM